MEPKTQIHAEDGKQEIFITREFNLPLHMLFKARTEAKIIEQWMGTKVLKLEARKHGSYLLETTDPKGNKHRFNGTIHDIVPDHKIIRTFEMEHAPFEPQLEFLEFEKWTKNIEGEKSKLTIHMVFRSVELRNEILKLPFAQGIDMAHNKLQDVVSKLIENEKTR